MFKPAEQKIDALHWDVFTGTIVSDQVWSETRVSGGGGGIAINGIGVGSSKTRSTVTNKREFAVERADGLQEIFQFNADAVKVAPGQVVSIVRVSRNNGKSYTNLAVINHSMRKTQKIQGLLSVYPLYLLLAIGAVPATILAFVLLNTRGGGGLGMFMLLGNLVHIRPFLLKQAFDAKLTALCEGAEASVKQIAPTPAEPAAA